MIDFPVQEPTVGTAVFAFLSYLLVLKIGFLKRMNRGVQCLTLGSGALFTLAVLMAIHTINGDFFHMLDAVHNYDFTPGAYHAQEPVYVNLAQIINKNYLLFRLIVWCSAFYAIFKTYKMLKINCYFAIWTFLACYSLIFAYARASAAMAIYYFGFVLLVKQGNNIIIRILGVALLFLSYEFHHSMAILILLTPLAFVRLSKKAIYFALSSLPILIVLVRYFFSNVLNDASILDNDTLQERVDTYSVRTEEVSIRMDLMNLVKYLTVYLPFISGFLYMLKSYSRKVVDKTIFRLFVFTFCLLLVTSAVSFLDMEINTFFYRMLFMAIIPSVAFFVYLIQKNIMPVKVARKLILFCIFSQLLNYIYMIYNNIVN